MTRTIQELIDWARQIGAQEFGVYIVFDDGHRIVIPLSLTADDLPGPGLPPTPPCADPRP